LKGTILKKIFIVILASLLFTGCNSNLQVKTKDTKAQNTKVTNNTNRSTPEETVKSYYRSEISKDAEFLSEYFVNPVISETGSVKKKLNAFKVDKMEVIKLFNVKKQGNYAVIICSFNTYFKGIKNPRPDIEIASLVNKNGSWYIINDYGTVSDKDMEWLNASILEEKQFLEKDSDIQKMLSENKKFDQINSAFILRGQKAMIEMQTSNSSF